MRLMLELFDKALYLLGVPAYHSFFYSIRISFGPFLDTQTFLGLCHMV